MNGISRFKPIANLRLQQGMVLLLCMIFLTAMMLLGLGASADTILQNQLVSNLHESEKLKQSAQAALINAEQWLLRQDNPEPQPCLQDCASPVIYAINHLPLHPEHESYSWWLEQGHRLNSTASVANSESSTVDSADNAQIWLIESVFSIDAPQDSPVHRRVWYRILARAGNRSGTVVSVVESLFVRSWPLNETSQEEDEVDCSVPASCGRVAWRRLR